MNLFEGKTPSERNKLIAAMALGVLAFASLAYMFFGSSSSPSSKNRNANSNKATQTQSSAADITTTQTTKLPSPSQVKSETESLSPPTPVVYPQTQYSAPEAGRNIFAFYVAPTPTPKAVVIATPTPPPPPPLVLASLSPMNVFARTGEFTLEVSGDKFTPASAIIMDNNPLPTRYVNAQQLSATVPAAMIANDGARQIKVSTPDGTLYSNVMPLMVTPPPVPNYLYIGIIGKAHYNDTAVLKDKSNPKELLNVQRGDVLGGRFRVTSISDREIELTDTALRIKHKLPFMEERAGQAGNKSSPGVRGVPIDNGESGIPGIPNVPRYQPPAQQSQDDDDDDGIPNKPNRL
jgi:hypothetical protein